MITRSRKGLSLTNASATVVSGKLQLLSDITRFFAYDLSQMKSFILNKS